MKRLSRGAHLLADGRGELGFRRALREELLRGLRRGAAQGLQVARELQVHRVHLHLAGAAGRVLRWEDVPPGVMQFGSESKTLRLAFGDVLQDGLHNG